MTGDMKESWKSNNWVDFLFLVFVIVILFFDMLMLKERKSEGNLQCIM